MFNIFKYLHFYRFSGCSTFLLSITNLPFATMVSRCVEVSYKSVVPDFCLKTRCNAQLVLLI